MEQETTVHVIAGIVGLLGGGMGSFLVHLFVTKLVRDLGDAIKDIKELSVKFAAFTAETERSKQERTLIYEHDRKIAVIESMLSSDHALN